MLMHFNCRIWLHKVRTVLQQEEPGHVPIPMLNDVPHGPIHTVALRLATHDESVRDLEFCEKLLDRK